MEYNEKQRLIFRRQYLIAPQEIECPFLCNQYKLNNKYVLYAHVDLLINEISYNDIKITLLGDMFDYENPSKNNNHILNDIIDIDFDLFLEKISKYSGRFLLIYQNKEKFRLVHDPGAARKVYYVYIEGKAWFGSLPNLLSQILNLKETDEPSKLDYYKSADYRRLYCSNVGNFTIYDEVYQLLPNHYYDLCNHSPVRYWPLKQIETLPLEEVVERYALILKGFMSSISFRYKIMLPVTAGKDSRLLLAATRHIIHEVYYYINHEAYLSDKSSDVRIPKLIFKKLGLDFHIEKLTNRVDENFKKIYVQNYGEASTIFLPTISNYYINHSDRVNIPGVNAADAVYRGKFEHVEITAKLLAEINGLEKYPFAISYYSNWLSECKDYCYKTGVNPLNLFYWEERMANWGAQFVGFKDIAQEEFGVFNSRILLNLYLGINYKLLKPPSYVFYYKVIDYLWREVLSQPFNPSISNKIKKVLELTKLLDKIYRLKSKIK